MNPMVALAVIAGEAIWEETPSWGTGGEIPGKHSGRNPRGGRGWRTERMPQRLGSAEQQTGYLAHNILCMSNGGHRQRQHFPSPQGTHNLVGKLGLTTDVRQCENCCKKDLQYHQTIECNQSHQIIHYEVGVTHTDIYRTSVPQSWRKG